MEADKGLYQFQAVSLQGEAVSMEQFAGMVVLVVNTASKCGFTPQYAGLEEIYRRYKDRGFVVLGFPSNQFARQEPGDASSIEQTCYINYGVSFPMFEKTAVNGRRAHPLFWYLKQKLPGPLGGRIPWNFTKFLIDHSGRPVKRFAPAVKPESILPDIEMLLNEKEQEI